MFYLLCKYLNIFQIIINYLSLSQSQFKLGQRDGKQIKCNHHILYYEMDTTITMKEAVIEKGKERHST